eukprot:CAMPEP_0196754832 /NCGR_PEP_ID=MMETSP1091-20130531/95274_1 /TAXON_ID=302021 /ORGANISM="Rhodomonas sp., Strain CCMP768" /LENGTH=52 /DNA_ID=CAMNT_0042103155 /DNA_START=142 /DNA_END=297 /DNA_ORIENTATION=+
MTFGAEKSLMGFPRARMAADCEGSSKKMACTVGSSSSILDTLARTLSTALRA